MNAQSLVATAETHLHATSREEAIRNHVGLVHQTVSRICGSVAQSRGTYDDLVSAGLVALVSAFDGFDTGRGVAFSTYAAPKVRGAVLDEMRRQDAVPRSVRRKARVVSNARAKVSARTASSCTARDVAAELGVDMPTLFRWEMDAQMGNAESLDSMVGESGHTTVAASDFWNAELPQPDAALLCEEEVDTVRSALASLPEQERLVLILYFYEDLKLKQIGELVGVSESRVSQIRTRALSRLRLTLAANAA